MQIIKQIIIGINIKIKIKALTPSTVEIPSTLIFICKLEISLEDSNTRLINSVAGQVIS